MKNHKRVTAGHRAPTSLATEACGEAPDSVAGGGEPFAVKTNAFLWVHRNGAGEAMPGKSDMGKEKSTETVAGKGAFAALCGQGAHIPWFKVHVQQRRSIGPLCMHKE